MNKRVNEWTNEPTFCACLFAHTPPPPPSPPPWVDLLAGRLIKTINTCTCRKCDCVLSFKRVTLMVSALSKRVVEARLNTTFGKLNFWN